MGRAQGFDGVRYVSPVTARLFSKAGHSEVLGLSAGEVLAPIEANWRDHRQRSGQAPTLEEAAGEEEEAAPPPMAGGMAMQHRHVEVVRPSAASPVPSVEGLTSPQAHLELILLERVSLRVCVTSNRVCVHGVGIFRGSALYCSPVTNVMRCAGLGGVRTRGQRTGRKNGRRQLPTSIKS